MNNALLNDYQSACRAAHKQVQMLQDLYRDFLEKIAELRVGFDVEKRRGELRDFRVALAQKLKDQHLLPTRPDPEREGLVELLTGVMDAFTPEDHSAARERLATEESELLRLAEQLAAHDQDPLVEKAVARTRATIDLLRTTSESSP